MLQHINGKACLNAVIYSYLFDSNLVSVANHCCDAFRNSFDDYVALYCTLGLLKDHVKASCFLLLNELNVSYKTFEGNYF